jgi:phage protein GP46
MDREISPLTGDYTSKQISTLQNAVYIRLTTPLGTWWADGRVGSLLHTIPKEKDLRHVGPLAQQYAEEALQPLIDDGRADEIIVTYTQPHNGLLILDISIRDNRGESYQFKHPVKVI